MSALHIGDVGGYKALFDEPSPSRGVGYKALFDEPSPSRGVGYKALFDEPSPSGTYRPDLLVLQPHLLASLTALCVPPGLPSCNADAGLWVRLRVQ